VVSSRALVPDNGNQAATLGAFSGLEIHLGDLGSYGCPVKGPSNWLTPTQRDTPL